MGFKDQADEIAVKLAEMAEEHLPSVIRIENDSFPTPWSIGIFQRALRDGKTRSIVALLKEEVIGYAVFWIIGDFAELGNIAVRERWRGRGVGEMLLSSVISTCAVLGARSLFLEVRESNRAAQNLYEKKGFADITRRERYYTNPVEDALVYGLDIQTGKNRGGPSG